MCACAFGGVGGEGVQQRWCGVYRIVLYVYLAKALVGGIGLLRILASAS